MNIMECLKEKHKKALKILFLVKLQQKVGKIKDWCICWKWSGLGNNFAESDIKIRIGIFVICNDNSVSKSFNEQALMPLIVKGFAWWALHQPINEVKKKRKF